MSGLQSVSRVKAERLTVLRALCLWNMSLCAANISACWQAKYNTHKSAAAAQTDGDCDSDIILDWKGY